MAKRLYANSVTADCAVELVEVGNEDVPGYLPDPLPDPLPLVRTARSGITVRTRCPDFGNVEVEIWAGDPGPRPPGWDVIFDDRLETKANGFDATDGAGPIFHLNAAQGTHRVRAEARRDDAGRVDAVRFIFPDGADVTG